LPQLGVDLGGVGEALVPPLADVRLELIQLRFPAHAGHQLIGAGGPGVPLHGPAVHETSHFTELLEPLDLAGAVVTSGALRTVRATWTGWSPTRKPITSPS
jgi:hypothetical protein